MKREELEKLGLTAETLEKAGLEKDVIDKIMALHGKDIEGFKAKVETADGSTAELQKQLDKANETIQGFENMKPEEAKAEVEKWKAEADKFKQEAEQAKKDADDRVQKLQFDSALTDALKNAKAKDPKEILPHLDMDLITFKDGKLGGLEDQLKPLAETKDYLFVSDNPELKIITKTDGKTTQPQTAFEAAAWKGSGLKPPEN